MVLRARLLSLILLLSLGVNGLFPTPVSATPTKGLLIAPLKAYLKLAAGDTTTSTLTIGNLTSAPMTATLSLKQFSVSDYAYDYHFSDPSTQWVTLSASSVQLQPNETKKVSYEVHVPQGSAPGGSYYTFIASAPVQSGGVASTVQAASLLYLTVSGQLIQTSQPLHSRIDRFVYRGDIHYSIDVKNTGNVHYFAYFSGNLRGLLGHTTTFGTSHLLLPGTTRRVNETIPAPLLPGLYKAHYGYKTDAGTVFATGAYVLYVPPWAVIALLFGVVAASKLWRQVSRRR